MGRRNLKDLLFSREEPAYKAGRQFLIEVQNLGRDIGGIDADLVNSEGEQLHRAIEYRVRIDAKRTQERMLPFWRTFARMLRDETSQIAVPGALQHLDDNFLVQPRIVILEGETGLPVTHLLRLGSVHSELIPEIP
jgi:hypothetical protein